MLLSLLIIKKQLCIINQCAFTQIPWLQRALSSSKSQAEKNKIKTGNFNSAKSANLPDIMKHDKNVTSVVMRNGTNGILAEAVSVHAAPVLCRPAHVHPRQHLQDASPERTETVLVCNHNFEVVTD